MPDAPFDGEDEDREWKPIPMNVSDAWRDIMETQAFLRDDPRGWGVQGVSRYDTHHLEVYAGEPVDESHEGDIVPRGLLAFMAGRGWQVTTIYIGQVPGSGEWVPCIGFSRGPEVFDALVNCDIPVEPDGYTWPALDAVTQQ